MGHPVVDKRQFHRKAATVPSRKGLETRLKRRSIETLPRRTHCSRAPNPTPCPPPRTLTFPRFPGHATSEEPRPNPLISTVERGRLLPLPNLHCRELPCSRVLPPGWIFKLSRPVHESLTWFCQEASGIGFIHWKGGG